MGQFLRVCRWFPYGILLLAAAPSYARAQADNDPNGVILQASSADIRADGSSSLLSEAVRAALERDPDIRMARAELSAAEIETDMARSGYFPAVSASAGPETKGAAYDVTVSQTVYDFGLVRSQVGRGTALAGRQQAQVLVKRDDVALQVSELWLDIASRRQVLSLMRDHVAELERLQGMASERVRGGYSDEAEVSRANLAVATAVALRARLEGELQEAEVAYQAFVGRPAGEVPLPDNPGFLLSLRSPVALHDAIAASPLYRRSVQEAEAASAGLREAEAARYPRLVIEGGVQRREIGGSLVDDSTIGVRLRMPTQQGLSGLQRPRLEAARLEASRSGIQATTRDLERTVIGLVAADRELESQLAAANEQVAQSHDVRATYWDQFSVGFRGLSDLITIETECFEADRQIIDLSVQRLRNEYRAAAQLGLLADSFNSRSGRLAGSE